jgi:hypothetical protein
MNEQKNILSFVKDIVKGEYSSAQKSLEQCVQDKLKQRVQEYTSTETFKKFNAGE